MKESRLTNAYLEMLRLVKRESFVGKILCVVFIGFDNDAYHLIFDQIKNEWSCKKSEIGGLSIDKIYEDEVL